MKRLLGLFLALALLLTLAAGCGKIQSKTAVTEAKVTLPESTGTKAVVEGETVMTTQLYLLARAYCEKLAAYDTDNFDAEDYCLLVEEAAEAFRIAEDFSTSLEAHAETLAEIEETMSSRLQTAVCEIRSRSVGTEASLPFITVASAAEEKSSAVRYAEELTKTFDEAKNGERLKAVAEKYGTDVKKAKVMLEQAQAILEGAAYADQAEFENQCYQAAVATKAVASTAGFVVSVMVSGGMTAGGMTAAGFIEAGGIVCNGVQAVIDIGSATTIYLSNGEGNEGTAYFEKADEILGPVSAFFAIGGGVQNILNIRNPAKAAEKVDNAAQALLAGIGFARDYIQDGKVLGISAEMIDNCKTVFFRDADTSDPEAVKELLTETGFSEEILEQAETFTQDTTFNADAYTETCAELIDTENPVDTEAFLAEIDAAFTAYAEAEDTETETETATDAPTDTESPTEAHTETPTVSGTLSIYDVAGSYYFAELEESADMLIAVVDETHLSVTDVAAGEGIVGEYDEATGTFCCVISEDYAWYVTIVFTRTANGIHADYKNAIGSNLSDTASAMKNP